MSKQKTNLCGQKFGRWTVKEEAESYLRNTGSTIRRLLCKCDCGTERVVLACDLRSGKSKSCGCWQIDNPNLKHGHARRKRVTGTYQSWVTMVSRCTNPNTQNYKYYGGRGIAVCERWLGEDGFNNFLADIGEKPKGLSLERENNNGNYEPGNCKWATKEEQANNQRSNVKIWTGEGYVTMSQFARVHGIPYEKIQRLYQTKKLSVDQILLQNRCTKEGGE